MMLLARTHPATTPMAETDVRPRRITKRVVDALAPDQIVWDTDVKGFGVRCQRRDKVYLLKARVSGRQRWFTIGKHGSPWTAEKARERALRMLAAIADGHDLAALREADRVALPSVS